MPAIFRHNGYRFFFYSNEGDPREAAHVHVQKGAEAAKYWLEPDVRFAGSAGMDASTVRALERIVLENRELFVRRWNEHFS